MPKPMMNQAQAEQLRVAAEYREQMFQVARKRGMNEAEASRFAAVQVETQLILRMRQQEAEMLKRAKNK